MTDGSAARARPSGAAVVAAAALAVASLTLFPEQTRLQHLGDDFVVPLAAERWRQGELPYRDFSEFVGPLPLALTRLVFEAAGVSSRTAHAVPAAASVGVVCACAFVAARACGPAVGALAGLWALSWTRMAFGLCAHHHALGHLLALLALLPWTGSRPPGARGTLLSGALLGACLVTRQHLAVAMSAAVAGLALLDPAGRGGGTLRFGRLAAGFAVAPLVCVAAFAAAGASDDLLRETLVWPFAQYLPFNARLFPAADAARGVLESFVPGGGGDANLGFAGLCVPPLWVLGTVYAWRERSENPAALRIALCGGAWLGAALMHPRTVALGWASVLLFPVAFHFLARAARGGTLARVASGALLLLVSIPFARLATEQAADAVAFRTRPKRVWESAVGPWVAQGEAAWLRFRAVETLAARAGGEPILFYPYMPGAYFCLARRCELRRSVLIPEYIAGGEMQEVAARLCGGGIRAAVVETRFLDAARLSRFFPRADPAALADDPVQAALARCFHVQEDAHGYVLHRHGAATSPAP